MGRMLDRLVGRRLTRRLALPMSVGVALLIEGFAALATEKVAHPICSRYRFV